MDIIHSDTEHAALVRKSDLFDEKWYFKKYKDINTHGMDAALHYVRHGAAEGRDPSQFFCTNAYWKQNPDVKAAGMNPLVHYLRHGKDERRLIAPPPSPAINRESLTYSYVYASTNQTLSTSGKTNRIAVFASFSPDGIIQPYVQYYLTALKRVCDRIIFVSDNGYALRELEKISHLVNCFICEQHGEYDFCSYKRGINHAKKMGYLESAEELLLCNDSCYGPVNGFEAVFNDMQESDCDFWGMTDSAQPAYHLQSHFMVFRKNILTTDLFLDFFDKVVKKEVASCIAQNYETQTTSYFMKHGYKVYCYINDRNNLVNEARKKGKNIERMPISLMRVGCPLVNLEAFKHSKCNFEGIGNTLQEIRPINPELYSLIIAHANPEKFIASRDLKFSIILPFRNRKEVIFRAIDSVLAQYHQNYDLIIVDDASTDDASISIASQYKNEISTGKIKLLRLEQQAGAASARNVGLSQASGSWIAYLDSDNYIYQNFLSSFSDHISECPGSQVFYAFFNMESDGSLRGNSAFDRTKLLKNNFIDLGVFVHSREIYERLGGFDNSMKRLIDWDLIIRYTENYTPVCVGTPLMCYNDSISDSSRITLKESFDDARIYIRKKHKIQFSIDTIIPTFNHDAYISEALDSAVRQCGDFKHRILVCSDGSNDRTRDIVKEYASKFRGLVFDISNDKNLGISATYRHCIKRVNSDFIAVLEGDDCWTSERKLQKQLDFLLDNIDCSMVFSMIELVKSDGTPIRKLKRQISLQRNKLTGADFLANKYLNLIVNFSSCLFKTGLMKQLPTQLYEKRLSEIALAFHLEKHGSLGFLPEVLSAYRQHPNGVWSGNELKKRLEDEMDVRKVAKTVADVHYHEGIQKSIDEKAALLQSQLGKR